MSDDLRRTNWRGELTRRLAPLYLRPEREAEIVDELSQHLDDFVRELVAGGATVEEARRAALADLDVPGELARRMGRVERPSTDVHARTSTAHWWRALGPDWSLFRRSPAFAAGAVLLLSVGIGVSATMIAVVDALMFRPPAVVREPDRLVAVGARNYVEYDALASSATSVDLSAYTSQSLRVGTGVDAMAVRAECVTANYFDVLGVAATRGRTFREEETRPGSERLVVLSHAFWTRAFGRDAAVVGRSLVLAGRTFSIVGVAPSAFNGAGVAPIDVWIALRASPELCSFTGTNLLASSNGAWLWTLGRLRPGVSIDRTRAELSTIAASALGSSDAGSVQPLATRRASQHRGDAMTSVWLAAGAAALLLIACANLAGLLSIRAHDRQRDARIRLQLGATIRHLRVAAIREAIALLVIGASGAALTMAGAWVLIRHQLRALEPFALTSRSMAALLAVAAIAVAASILPAIVALRTEATSRLRVDAVVARDRSTFRRALLVGQFALAMFLVVGAGLFGGSVRNAKSSLGYALDDVFVVTMDFQGAGVRRVADQRRALDALVARLSGMPGVIVGATTTSPLGTGRSSTVMPALSIGAAGAAPLERVINYVSPDYFESVGTRMLEGRAFAVRDDAAGARVAIVDEGLAAAMWPNEDVLGACKDEIALGRNGCVTIVGVSQTRRMFRLTKAVGEIFFPIAQGADEMPQAVFIRARQPSPDALAAIAAAVRTVDGLSAMTVRPLEDFADDQARAWITGATLFGAYGAIANALAALGLYAVLALVTRQRTPEIGMRVALGARPRDVVGLIVRQALAPLALGWTIGVCAAVIVAFLVRSQLFGVAPADPIALGIATATLMACALVGVVVPALRASRISPVRALRVLGVCVLCVTAPVLTPVAVRAQERPSDDAAMTGEGGIRKMASNTVKPVYPAEAVRRGIEGVVVARTRSGHDSRMLRVDILQAPDPLLAAAVTQALMQWRTSEFRSDIVAIEGKVTFYFRIERGRGRVLNPEEMPGNAHVWDAWKPASGTPRGAPAIVRPAGAPREIGETELPQLLAAGSAMLIDVRNRQDFAREHDPRATNLPGDEIVVRALVELPITKTIVIDGSRGLPGWARQCVKDLHDVGFKDVVVLVP
jgi:predicted permease